MTFDMFKPATTRDLEAEFAASWSVLPHRPGDPKAAAKAEWLKLGQGQKLPPSEIMVAACRAYCAHHKREKTEPKFLAHTRTFLHQQRFRDWMPGVVTPAGPAAPDWADESSVWLQWKAWVLKRDRRDWHMFLTMRPEDCGDHVVLWFKVGIDMDRVEIAYETALEHFLGKRVKFKREAR